jgi:putative addiction module component (TIGR02574 family)
MTTAALRNKMHRYVDDLDIKALEAFYQMIKLYMDESGESLMDKAQKQEIDERVKLFKEGKLKTSAWDSVKKHARKSI